MQRHTDELRQQSDEVVVIRCLKGEQAAFSILVERYQKQIFSLAYQLRRDYDEAQDLAQEAFVRIYQELPKFDQSRKFFPWMYRVAHNSCVNSLRKLSKEKAVPDDFSEFQPSDPTQDPVSSYEGLEQSERIAKAIREMPEQYRLPVLLKYMEGLSYEEISERMDLPVSTIESRLFRGRNHLRKVLHKEKQTAT